MGRHTYPQEALAASDADSCKTLMDYCRSLGRTLQARGYKVAHGTEIKKALDGSGDTAVPAGLYDYVQKTDKSVNEGDIVAGLNALVDKNYKLILLPNRQGLVRAIAEKNGLNTKRLHDMGLRDTHIYAGFYIHEASHVIGLHGRCWGSGDAFRFNEVDTYLHEFTRMMRTAGFGTRDCIPNFLASRKAMDNIIACFRTIDGETQNHINLRYQYTHSAAEWAITCADKPAIMDRVWNSAKDKFNLQALRWHLPGYCVQQMDGGHRRDHAYILALQQFKNTAGLSDDVTFSETYSNIYTMRDTALQAAQKCMQFGHAERELQSADAGINAGKGTAPSEQAALILRRLARSIDHVMRYADDYRPPGNGIPITHRCPVPAHSPG